MAKAVRIVPYSNSYSELIVTPSFAGAIKAVLFGGGGGGGGGPDAAGPGGNGGGGGASLVNFTVSPGDVIGIAPGGGGAQGATAVAGYGGGRGGNGYLSALNWSTLNLLTQPGIVQSQDYLYNPFLKTYGVWNTDIWSRDFNQTTTVYFPQAGTYTITGSVDDLGSVYIDDELVLSMPTFNIVYTSTVTLTQGYHNIKILGTNNQGPGGVAVTIAVSGQCFSGATGGNAGPSGSSGAGGGSGGATVLLLNGTIIGIAGGGGGGGGAGRFSYINACDAPGLNQYVGLGITAGQDGQNYDGDGGGGGAGGGGYLGATGGAARGYEATGYAGGFGMSYSNNGSLDNPEGIYSGGVGFPGRDINLGLGGLGGRIGQVAQPGTSGYAVFEFNQRNISVKNAGIWSPATAYIKQSGTWNAVKNAWIKQNGTWMPVSGDNGLVPNFTAVPGRFGYQPTPYPPPPPPEFF